MDEGDCRCAVCFELTPDRTPCGHTLCHLCAERWLARRASCPVCRAAVPPPPGAGGGGDTDDEGEEGGGDVRRLVDALGPLPPLAAVGWESPQVYFWEPLTPREAVGFSLRHHLGPPRGIHVASLTRPPHPHFLQAEDVITHINGRRALTVDYVYRQLSDAIENHAWIACAIMRRPPPAIPPPPP